LNDRPDTQYIYVSVGYGFHLQLTLDEATTFIERKVKHLKV
jgi:prefoldin subunit 5